MTRTALAQDEGPIIVPVEPGRGSQTILAEAIHSAVLNPFKTNVIDPNMRARLLKVMLEREGWKIVRIDQIALGPVAGQ